jgi:hypothetical protein
MTGLSPGSLYSDTRPSFAWSWSAKFAGPAALVSQSAPSGGLQRSAGQGCDRRSGRWSALAAIPARIARPTRPPRLMGVLNDGALAVKPVNGDIFNNYYIATTA